MLMKMAKWFYMVVLIAAIGLTLVISTAFAGDIGKGTQEGIKVHGHWKIEVFNPDGIRVSTTEFENALTTYGMTTIKDLIIGNAVTGGMGIILGPNGCDDGTGNSNACFIAESGVSYDNTFQLHSSNLTITDNTNSFILNGSVIADYATSLTYVNTYTKKCAGTTTTINDCRTTALSLTVFTASNITAIPVVAGQLIQVTVTISFS